MSMHIPVDWWGFPKNGGIDESHFQKGQWSEGDGSFDVPAASSAASVTVYAWRCSNCQNRVGTVTDRQPDYNCCGPATTWAPVTRSQTTPAVTNAPTAPPTSQAPAVVHTCYYCGEPTAHLSGSGVPDCGRHKK